MSAKAAKNVEAGDWVVLGSMAFLAGECWTEDGTTYIRLGYEVYEYKPNARVTIQD